MLDPTSYVVRNNPTIPGVTTRRSAMAIKGKLPWALLFFCCCLCFSLPRSAADNALVDAVYQDALRLSPAEREVLVSKLTNGPGASFPVRDLESVFDWRVPQRYRKLGHTYHGDTDRLRLAMHKLLTGGGTP